MENHHVSGAMNLRLAIVMLRESATKLFRIVQ
jgi:hypothetical protein